MTQEASWQPPVRALSSTWLESELSNALVDEVASAERCLFDKLAGGSQVPLVLFGSGNLGRRVLSGLRNVGVEPLAFADNNADAQGSIVDGLRVHSAADAVSAYGDKAVFVVTIWVPLGPLTFPAVASQLRALDDAVRVVSFVPLFWKYADEFLPYYFLDLPHRLYENAQAVKDSYELLSDDRSCFEYLLELSYLMSIMDSVEVPRPVGSDWYFPKELFALGDNEVFVDCGAYDGDTLTCFLEASEGSFGEIVAFECDPLAIPRLEDRVNELPPTSRTRVRVVPKAVGASSGVLRFEGDGSPGSHFSDEGQITVECCTLDEVLRGTHPTLIKMDIEGAEEDALRGAERTIRESRPILAICIYHRQSDLYRLPAQINAMCPDYTISIRRQGDDGDLVCFAIPNERMRSN